MSLLKRDTVSITRFTEDGDAAIDELGHPTLSVASGFPVSVTGHFSHRGASSVPADEGLNQRIDAVFYAHTWASGEIGDFLTYESVEYVILSVEPKYKSGRTLDHVRYALARQDAGSAGHGV